MEFQPLPLDLVASLPELPFPVYLRRDGRMILYAMPGADLGAALGRTKAGLQVHVPSDDAGVMRRLLVLLLARSLGSRSEPIAERGRRAAALAMALLGPLFGPERSLDAEAFVAGQAAVDLISEALAREPALGRAVVGGHPPPARGVEAEAEAGAFGASAGARQFASHALDGLACALLLAGMLARDGAALDGTTMLGLGRGVAFRDLGLSRAPAVGALRRLRPVRTGATANADHPALGVRLVGDALGWQPAWISLVASHHERLDGSGYPTGRRGGDLPRATRVAGLADTFASLIAPAAWGRVRTAEEAIGVLRLGARARFGDDLVWALVRVLDAGQLLPSHRHPSGAMTH